MEQITISPEQINQTHLDSAGAALDPLGDQLSSLALVRVSGSDLDIVNAARVSYGKTSTTISQRDKQLIGFLMQYEHTSPFEHNQLSFRVKAPIFVARQWMRHRMNSYNEISYRFVKSPLEFYIPRFWRNQDTVNKQGSVGFFENEEFRVVYKNALEQSVKSYEFLLAQGVSREQARAVLPVCTYTEFMYTCNLHSLMHFLRLRLDAGAQYEIRRFAMGLYTLAKPHFDVSLSEWKRIHMPAVREDEWSVDFVKNLSNTK
jgi:thymidylate synthase (FAD)